MEIPLKDREMVKILAIDGGGVRGIYAAHALDKMQRHLGRDFKFSNFFDIIAGTSTGSIIAAGLSVDVPTSEIVDLYESQAENIFRRSKFSIGGTVKPMYEHCNLEKALMRKFGDQTLSDARTRLIIPATDVSNAAAHVFKSDCGPGYIRDRDVPLHKAVLASCAAPLYFRPAKLGNYLLADGGIWANNPSLVAVIEAIAKLKVDKSKIRLLSVGTGSCKSHYSLGKTNWGFYFGWGGIKKFLSMLMDLQSTHANNVAKILLNEDQCIRVNFNFENPKQFLLDDATKICDLKSRADHDLTHRFSDIQKLFHMKEG